MKLSSTLLVNPSWPPRIRWPRPSKQLCRTACDVAGAACMGGCSSLSGGAAVLACRVACEAARRECRRRC